MQEKSGGSSVSDDARDAKRTKQIGAAKTHHVPPAGETDHTLRPASPRTPLKTLECDLSVGVKFHALDLEPDPLLDVALRNNLADAEPPPGIDHPVPRHRRLRGESIQRIADLAGVPGETRELRYLPIRGDQPRRDPADAFIEALVPASRFQSIPFARLSQCITFKSS